MRKNISVGVFDSGVGGLTTLAECGKLLPSVTYYYWGDNARAPYGSLPPAEIADHVREALLAFEALGVSAAVLACNTATAVCAEEMRREFPFPIVGIEPAVSLAAKKCASALILCTPRTAESPRLASLIARNPSCRFTVAALPRLAAAVEIYLAGGEKPDLSAHLPRERREGVVLGCTHYCFLRSEIARFYGCEVFDGGEGTARRLVEKLKVGTSFHFQPQSNTDENLRNFEEKSVIFLGSGAKLNRRIFITNKCF